MGRSRRRNRHLTAQSPDPDRRPGAERLTPAYAPVAAAPWRAESDTPVLPIEGLSPWDVIEAPALLLDEDEAPAEEYLADSTDPRQLDLSVEMPRDARAAAVQTELAIDPGPAARRDGLSDTSEEPVAAPAPAIDPVEALYAEAREATDAGRLLDARKLYRELLGRAPGHIRARNNLALLLENARDQAGALVEYDRALDVEPEHVTLLTNRGALLGSMGRYAAAERDLKRALRAEPNHPEALFNLGVVMTKKGLWAEAVEHLRRAVELDPQRGPAHFYLGEALNHVDDLAGAMAAYQRAAELMPDNPRALYGLGIVYDRLGRPDDAARMYRKSREVGRR